MRSRSLFVVAALFTVGLAGCVSDPQDPRTWIKKLDDPRESKQAVRELQRLNKPEAVEPLIALYKKTKDPEVLKAVAQFKDKRSAPVMLEALGEFTADSFDNAATAATALGDVGDTAAVDALTKAILTPLPIKTRANVVKLEAMKSLGKLKDKKAVTALIKVLETPADEQDFFLNQTAASTLGELADPKAVPALVRGLFMTGRGSDIFQPCRLGLLKIGQPAVQSLIDAHQHKNEVLEADAKKYEFRAGVIEQKTALVLGDMRAKEAQPVLVAELKKPQKGDNHTGALYALGMLGDAASVKEIVGVLTTATRDWKVRVSAAEALNLAQDPSTLPTLLTVAKTGDVVKEGEKYPDVRIAAAMAYSRLGGKAEAAAFLPVAKGETAAKAVFDECMQRLEVAAACSSDKDRACFEKALDDKVLAKQEKAAFFLARFGKEALPALTKRISHKEPIVRLAVMYSVGKVATAADADVRKALDAQIEIDRTKPPLRGLVEEMRALAAILANKK